MLKYQSPGVDANEKKIDASRYIIFQLYCSLLFEVDEWDAKSWNYQNRETEFPLFIKRENISTKSVSNYIESKSKDWDKIATPKHIINLRVKTFQQASKKVQASSIPNLFTLSAPTGAGKTLALLNAALILRDRYIKELSVTPKIIYCLPFISITNQVGKIVSEIIALAKNKPVDQIIQSPNLTLHHHLAPIKWQENENEDYIVGSPIHLLSLWDSEFIITTFVQLWDHLITGFKRDTIPFNRFANSIIILDEIQSIPFKYWELFEVVSTNIVNLLQSTFILSTATQPAIYKKESSPIELTNSNLIASVSRYSIMYQPIEIDTNDFITNFIEEYRQYSKLNVLIVVNTRRIAYKFLTALKNADIIGPLFLLSTYLTSKDRIKSISTIDKTLKNTKGLILISTQVIEAGIDFDFDLVFRDIAPLDSLVQVAGRCNRSGKQKESKVHIINLKEGKSIPSHQVYDNRIIRKTKEILEDYKTITEDEVPVAVEKYFQSIRSIHNVSEGVTELITLNYKGLSKLRLIQKEFKMICLVLENSHNQKLIASINDKKRFPNTLWKDSIQVNNNDIDPTLKKRWIPIPEHEPICFVISKEEVLNYYSSRSGWKIPM